MREVITITDEEIPPPIRGQWKSTTILGNSKGLELGGHSDAVCDGIAAAIVHSGAETKEDVLKVLERIASEVSDVQGKKG
ncbi:hypothetical protein HY213_03260 [Candidatus Peregrinibacteria bacterium]|nr:hypothetical protein [Candidatus Peregrinibacteria bacterium]